MRGLVAVLRKEMLQMRRDRATVFFALAIPIFQLVVFGTIDTTVERVPTVVHDLSRTQASRALVEELVATDLFEIVGDVDSHEALRREIVAGHAQVGLEIPPEFARRRLERRSAEFLLLIDGSDNSVSSQTLSAATGLALYQSLEEALAAGPRRQPALRPHPVMLFNPDSRSANLLIPGLVAILLTISGTVLAAFAVVRERERGTLEQLMVTPVSPLAVVVGKLVPYLALAFVQLQMILGVMVVVFRVPIHGSLAMLEALALIYLWALVALGLMISTRAKTQAEAIQMAMGVILPSVLLSGYIFPLSSLPAPVATFSQIIPATHFIAISRGIVLRDAGFLDLWQHVAALVAISAVLIAFSARAFKKTLG